MSALSLQQDGYDEFRWTIATLGALTCCAITLTTVIILWATGDRFDYRPAASALSRYDDELVQAFEALEATEAARKRALSPSMQNPQISSAASPETSQPSDVSSATNRCSVGSWPYSGENCLWAADAPKRRRIVLRLKSPWCSGVLRQQPFHRCRTRPG